MDIFSHGLWSAAIYKTASIKRPKKKIGWAVFFGVAPDIFSFGLVFLGTIIATGSVFPQFMNDHGLPDATLVPKIVHVMYNITHSLVVFGLVFGVVALIRKKPFWEMGAWGLHVLSDIPTHTAAFFPTPFLWPASSFSVSGISWANPIFLSINYSLLALVFIGIYFWERRVASR